MKAVRVLSYAVLVILSACGGEGPTTVVDRGSDVAALSLDRSELELWVGASRGLVPTARDGSGAPIDVPLTWTSSDPSVADVTVGGVVSARGPGAAVVTATAESGIEATTSVTSLGLVDPMTGVLNESYYYTNYFDQSSGSSFQDYQCGPKSYDGHLGVDIVLPDFRTMDDGIDVLAAGNGRVIETHDGEFDRNKTWGPNPWNVVVVDHGGQLQTMYGHLKKGSVAVAVGDSVTAGAKLGEVGSSGRSDMPHLHLELRQGGRSVDPYGGPCSQGRQYFEDPMPYQDEFRLIGAEVTDEALSLDRIKDGLAPVDTIALDDDRVWVWVHLHNKVENANIRFEIVRPDGAAHGTIEIGNSPFYSFSWWWGWWDRSGLAAWPGEWTVTARYEGRVLATRTFHLEGLVTGEALAPPAQTMSRSGAGGGGLRGG